MISRSKIEGWAIRYEKKESKIGGGKEWHTPIYNDVARVFRSFPSSYAKRYRESAYKVNKLLIESEKFVESQISRIDKLEEEGKDVGVFRGGGLFKSLIRRSAKNVSVLESLVEEHYTLLESTKGKADESDFPSIKHSMGTSTSDIIKNGTVRVFGLYDQVIREYEGNEYAFEKKKKEVGDKMREYDFPVIDTRLASDIAYLDRSTGSAWKELRDYTPYFGADLQEKVEEGIETQELVRLYKDERPF
ncbi:MAG: hypothetical protein MUP58_03015 [Candidatus Nanohaloarchaeota archaeon QJJ-9]|nr:hypothetical protein [Candidatus Nanohaloarchaeota archaeon QJJ-9]